MHQSTRPSVSAQSNYNLSSTPSVFILPSKSTLLSPSTTTSTSHQQQSSGDESSGACVKKAIHSVIIVSPAPTAVGTRPSAVRGSSNQPRRKERPIKPKDLLVQGPPAQFLPLSLKTNPKPKRTYTRKRKKSPECAPPVKKPAAVVDSLVSVDESEPKTSFSKTLFDSIDFLSSSWKDIFKQGNSANPHSLDLFRRFHCADCLKSFQQRQETTTNESTTGVDMLNNSNNNSARTPPPPLQPIVDETLTGLYHYFGGQNQPPPQPPAPVLSSIRLVSSTNCGPTSMDHDGQIDPTPPPPTISGPNSTFNFSREVTAMSLQEKRHTLNRKLAQRAPKHELVERGILPRTHGNFRF